jgi:hypothetical protein
MNTHVVIPFIASVAYLALLGVLLANRTWESRQKLFAAFVAVAFAYSYSDFFARSDFLMEQKVLLAKVVICAGIWTVVQFHYFIRPYFSRTPVRFPLAYLFVVATIALSLAGVIPRVTIVSEQGVTVYYGVPLLVIAVLIFALLGIRDAVLLFKRHRLATDAVDRNQTAYLIAGIALFSFFMLLSFVPGAGSYPVAHIGNLLVACVLSYAVVAHYLLDIGVFMRRALVMLVLYATGILMTLVALEASHLLFGVRFDTRTALAMVVIGVPVVLFLTHVVRDALQVKIEEVFVGSRFKARRQLSEFLERIYDVPTLGQFGRQLVSLLARSTDAHGGASSSAERRQWRFLGPLRLSSCGRGR